MNIEFVGDQPVSMKDKVCLITGGSSGIGKAAALGLSHLGATVVIVGRSASRCMETAGSIRDETSNAAVEYLVADLSSQTQVRNLTDRFRAAHDRLHVLVNSVGALFAIRRESIDGIEMTLALNHLAPFLLTNLLQDTLRRSAPARIINVSSNAYRDAKAFEFDDPQAKVRRYPRSETSNLFHSIVMPWAHPGFLQYAQSKLANLLFTRELARRLDGAGVTVNAMHPGFVASNFHNGNGSYGWFMRSWGHLFGIEPAEGAKTIVYLASSPDVQQVTGKYFIKQQQVPLLPAALDIACAKRLWQLSKDLTQPR